MDLKNLLGQTTSGKQLSEYQINLLVKNGIKTVQEFLKTDLPKLQNLLDINRIQYLYDIKVELIELLGKQTTCTFATLYKDEKKYERENFTGIEELDKLLKEIGQPSPGVWEIYGEAGVGKTQFMYCLAINFVCQQREQPKHALFIDCKGDIDAARIQEILEERKQPHPEKVMEAIKVEKVFNDQHLIAVLRALVKQREEKREEAMAIGLILIDCIPACFIHLRSRDERLLAKAQQTVVASLLRKLDTKGVASIVGNVSFGKDESGKIHEEAGMISEDSSETKPNEPLMGHYWKSICTLRLSLELPISEDDVTDIDKVIDDGIRVMNVVTNSYGPAGGSCHLKVSQAGII